METPRLLLLEDDSVDAQLLNRHLRKEWPGLQVVLASEERAYLEHLKQGGFDLILSDYSLPGFNGRSALALARQYCPDIPFIFVSGAIGDEVAVECLKAGATDYVLKDRLARLIPALRRALHEAAEDRRRRQMQEQLRHSEDQYRDLFENASDMIQSVGPDGRFLYVNRAWCQGLRYTEAEVGDLTIFDVVHPAYQDQCRERFQNATPNDCVTPWETIFITKYGHNIYVEGNLGPRFVGGNLVATRGIFRDVTEKKLTDVALRRSIRQFQALVNSVDGIVWQAEFPSLRFSFVSQQAERLLGYPVRCWLEEPHFWQNHIHCEDRARTISLCTTISAAQNHKAFEYRMVAADGSIVWLRDMVSLCAEEGEAPKLQGIMVDVTLRKQAEQKIQTIQDDLKRTNEGLVQKNQEIQSFYHILSHELKTPLTSAREFISIVMDGLGGPITKTQSEFLTIARESCDQLGVCIHDLLDATRLETGKLNLTMRPVSVRSLVRRVVTTLNSTAAAKQIALKQQIESELPDILLDERRIVQVLSNLLTNAISHTPPGGKVIITAAQPARRS